MTRDSIPEEIKRLVRSHCGFGCVICGEIACDYEHIYQYAEVKEHRVENIVMLCAHHHAEVTRGRLSKTRVREAQANPFARVTGRTAFYNFEAAPQKAIFVGGNLVIIRGGPRVHVLLYRNTPVVWFDFDEGVPLLSMEILNDKGDYILKIVRNQIVVNAFNIWDVRLSGTKFDVRRKSGEILFRVMLHEGSIAIERLKISVGGYNFVFKGTETSFAFGLEGRPMKSGAISNSVMDVGIEHAIFRVGEPEHGKMRIGAFWALGLPGDDD